MSRGTISFLTVVAETSTVRDGWHMVPFHFGFLGQRGHVCIDIAGETGLGLDEIGR